jgi:hypothetical protein
MNVTKNLKKFSANRSESKWKQTNPIIEKATSH